ncbi:MAG: NAD(P)-dependent oxidoreductase [Anaerolineae bacterium]|nr:NAD(P)-dependent oxidoreductase [Anaerolineae bacterium]
MASLGFVGLGMMGSRMVQRLLEADHEVIGHNRTRDKAEALIEQGMRWAETPRAVAEAADVIFSNVSDNRALEAIMHGGDGILAGLSAGKVYVVMSTNSPGLIRDLAAQVEALGAKMLDAPVSGSKLTLEMGKLTVIVAGDQAAYEQVLPTLHVIGPTVMHVGASGQAMAMKIAINISIVTQVISLAEGVLLAEKSGVPRAQAVDVMLNSAIASPALKYRGPFVAAMPAEAWFDVGMAQKDILLAVDLARELGVNAPTTAVAADLLARAKAMNLGDKDFAVVVQVLEHLSAARP